MTESLQLLRVRPIQSSNKCSLFHFCFHCAFCAQLWGSKWNWSSFRGSSGLHADRYKLVYSMERFHHMNHTILLFSAQCTALDGKCSISCDSEVTILHTTGKKVPLQAFNFTPFLLTFYFTWSSWQDINCYLIDNNGFILVTEEQSQVMTSEEQQKNFPQAINERLKVITLELSSFSFKFLKARGWGFFYFSVYFAVCLLSLLQRSKEVTWWSLSVVSLFFTVGF